MEEFSSYYDNSKRIRRILEVAPNTNIHYRDLQEMRENQQPISDMIDYVYKLFENAFPAIVKEEKSDAKAEEFRREGNALYILKSKNVEAIETYNKSICYAQSKENLSIGLANRSAVFFQMQMYPECVDSIRLAREAGIPERLKEKLDRREAQCQENMKTLKPETEDVFVPKIGLPVNEKIPFLAKCLSLREDSTYGRYVVADEDILAGTIIALEEPICKVLMDSEIYLRCANCLAEVPHLLLPCSTCTNTMFCSKECEKKAFDDFHAIECPISASLMMICGQYERLALRFVIRAFVAFQGDAAKMEAALEKMKREKKNVFDFDWSQELSPEDIYMSFYTLKINEWNEAKDELFITLLTSCLILNLLQRHSPIFIERFLTSPTAIKIFKNLIYHHVVIGSVHGCSLNSAVEPKETYSRSNFGWTITHSATLVKISCIPNISTFTMKTDKGFKNGLITLKKIATGEHLSCCSHSNHWIYPKNVRQKELFERFNFICKCVACTENYPMIKDVEEPSDIEDFDYDEESLVEKYSFDYNMYVLTKSTDYIRKYGHLYPIVQLACAEEALKFCLHFLCAKTSLRIKEKVRLSATHLDN